MPADPAIIESPLQEFGVLLYADALEHMADYLGGSSADTVQNLVRRAIQNGYNRLMNETDWRYLFQLGRVNMIAPVSDGTVAFNYSGGRQLTLTGSTWPDWVKFGRIKIANVLYDVASVTSSTVVTLTAATSPRADIASGTAYTLYRNCYPIASDFKRIWEPSGERTRGSRYVSPEDFLWLERQGRQAGTPYQFTIMRNPNMASMWCVYLYGYPSQAETLDFLYQRNMRDLVTTGYDTNDRVGTIANTGTLITGTATAFNSLRVGSYLRVSSSTSAYPTGLSGTNHFTEQRKIAEIDSNTSIDLDRGFDGSYSGVKYLISDPIDIPTYMQQAFYRCVEWNYAILTRSQNTADCFNLYRQELIKARESDSIVAIQRSLGGSSSYGDHGWRSPLAANVE